MAECDKCLFLGRDDEHCSPDKVWKKRMEGTFWCGKYAYIENQKKLKFFHSHPTVDLDLIRQAYVLAVIIKRNYKHKSVLSLAERKLAFLQEKANNES